MGRIKSIVVGVLVLATLAWMAGFTYTVYRLQSELHERAKQDVRVLTEQAVERGTTDVKQTEVRAAAKASVASVRAANKKEEQSAQEARPSLSDGQLDRLRRLQAAANAGIHSAE